MIALSDVYEVALCHLLQLQNPSVVPIDVPVDAPVFHSNSNVTPSLAIVYLPVESE